jgi:hypothetical protein
MENPFTCTISASRPDGRCAEGITAMPSQLSERIAQLAGEGADWVVVRDGAGVLYEGPSDGFDDWVAEGLEDGEATITTSEEVPVR